MTNSDLADLLSDRLDDLQSLMLLDTFPMAGDVGDGNEREGTRAAAALMNDRFKAANLAVRVPGLGRLPAYANSG